MLPMMVPLINRVSRMVMFYEKVESLKKGSVSTKTTLLEIRFERWEQITINMIFGERPSRR